MGLGDKKGKRFYWVVIYVCVLAFFIAFFTVSHKNVVELPVAKKALFDFRDINLDSISKIRLEGEVAFWWDTLINPRDLTNINENDPDGYIKLENEWNDFAIDNRKQKGNGIGYATYYFQIIASGNKSYAFQIEQINSAYDLWVNGELMNSAGKVSVSKKTSVPTRQGKVCYFQSKGDTINVVLHVSNFHLKTGGIVNKILFGEANQIGNYSSKRISVEFFLFGILFILSLYHIILYFFRKKDKSIILFSMVCLFTMLRLITTGEKVIFEIFPQIPYAIEIRIEYLSLLFLGIVMGWFMIYLFPKEISNAYMRVYAIIITGFILIILFTPSIIFSHTPIFFQLVILPTAAYVLAMVLVSIIRNRDFAIGIFNGFLLFFIFIVNDFLFYHKFIDSVFLMPFGLLFLIFSQTVALSRKSSNAFFKVEKLSLSLEKANVELEKRVEERTQKIQQQKEEILKQNLDLEELIKFKDKVTKMMVHDLKNPLSNIIGYTELPGGLSKYSENVHHSGVEMRNMIQNILDVEKYRSNELELRCSKAYLYKLVEGAYSNNHFVIYHKEIKFENLIPKDLVLEVDSELIERVFSNIISNGTRYDNNKGLIRISSESITVENKDFYKFVIYNGGDQIPEDKIDHIFELYEQAESPRGDFGYSSGIGLTFCRMAVNAHGGEIGIEQDRSQEKGVSFWLTLPV